MEHILPESADETWGDFKQEEIRRSVYRIGNLTLLERKLNREVDVLHYPEKAIRYAESNSFITKALAENYISWSENKISARQRELAKDAKAIWRIQEFNL